MSASIGRGYYVIFFLLKINNEILKQTVLQQN